MSTSKPHLVSNYGSDYGEIVEVSMEDSDDGIDLYYVWVKRPAEDDE